jgi:hypothetical protein
LTKDLEKNIILHCERSKITKKILTLEDKYIQQYTFSL